MLCRPAEQKTVRTGGLLLSTCLLFACWLLWPVVSPVWSQPGGVLSCPWAIAWVECVCILSLDGSSGELGIAVVVQLSIRWHGLQGKEAYFPKFDLTFGFFRFYWFLLLFWGSHQQPPKQILAMMVDIMTIMNTMSIMRIINLRIQSHKSNAN